ncbi:hypothetical protein ACHQM5_012683 [Ranunculus cassubicifolius]
MYNSSPPVPSIPKVKSPVEGSSELFHEEASILIPVLKLNPSFIPGSNVCVG